MVMDKYSTFVDCLRDENINWRRAEVLSNNEIKRYLRESYVIGHLSEDELKGYWHDYRCFQAGNGELPVQHREHLEAQAADGDLLSKVLLALDPSAEDL